MKFHFGCFGKMQFLIMVEDANARYHLIERPETSIKWIRHHPGPRLTDDLVVSAPRWYRQKVSAPPSYRFRYREGFVTAQCESRSLRAKARPDSFRRSPLPVFQTALLPIPAIVYGGAIGKLK